MPIGLLTLVAFLVAQPLPPQLPPEQLGPGDHSRTLMVGEQKRTYHVHVPPGYDAKKPAPVVLVLHGAAMSAAVMEWFCGMSAKADEAGFIAVYPSGTGPLLTWNAGLFPGGLSPKRADDVAFIRKVLDDVATVVRTDPRRVYATGMSNGAMMCYRLAVEMPDRIAAIAPVAGVMCLEKPEPKQPVPILHLHGTKDGLVPFTGTMNGGGPYRFSSVEDCIHTWCKVNGCAETPKVTELPTKEEKLKILRRDYSTGSEKAPVILYVIEGAGHTWPGMDRHASFLGLTTLSISANDVMWDFFKQQSLK
jgi:polyhydroxybutyrate depolymerase